MGHEHPSPKTLTQPAKRQLEADFIGQAHAALLQLCEAVIVCEKCKPSRSHTVTEIHGGNERLNQALMKLRQAQLPSAPPDAIAALDAASLPIHRRLHLEGEGNDLQVSRQQKTPLYRRSHDDFVS